MRIDSRFVILWDFHFFEKCLVALTFEKCIYRPKSAPKYNISNKDLWYWIWPKSIKTFKIFKILNLLKIISKLSNSGKFRIIEPKFCARMR